MIHGLASALEKRPYSLMKASKYLRDWVDEKLVLAAPLQVDIIQQVQPRFRYGGPSITSASVVPLEPSVSAITVHAAATTEAAATPKMIVIGGIATTLKKNNGLTWTDAFAQAYALWGKLNSDLVASLVIPEGNVPVQNLFPEGDSNSNEGVERGVEPPPMEDDALVPLDVADRSDF